MPPERLAQEAPRPVPLHGASQLAARDQSQTGKRAVGQGPPVENQGSPDQATTNLAGFRELTGVLKALGARQSQPSTAGNGHGAETIKQA